MGNKIQAGPTRKKASKANMAKIASDPAVKRAVTAFDKARAKAKVKGYTKKGPTKVKAAAKKAIKAKSKVKL